MAFNGSGTYNLPTGNPVVTGTTISSSWANTTFTDVASALTNCVTRDGQSPATNNLPMGGYKLTGVGAPTTTGDALVWGSNANVSGLVLGSLNGLLKASTGTVSAATANTDYLTPPSGTALLKANSGGALANAVSGTDYAPATSGTSIFYGNGAGGFSNVTIGSNLTFAGGTISAATQTGKIIQVVNSSNATRQDVTSTSYADAGVSASIIPTSSSNKILVLIALNGCGSSSWGFGSTAFTAQALRGSTVLGFLGKISYSSGAGTTNGYSFGFCYLDSPATTSSTTYKTQINSGSNTYAVSSQINGERSTITLMEITP
jgi:hypothetical protein